MKAELDRRVAARLGCSRKEVSRITFELLEVVRHVLVEEGEVVLPRLGVLRAKEVRVNRDVDLTTGTFKRGKRGRRLRIHVRRNFKVFFSKSAHLKDELEEHHGKVRSRRRS